ncbi:TrbC/VirB2 family protein [Megasphaera paucivorans]|uniref:Type IV secretion system protein VirB2 n=1 Tax=Megasphaera paucivorans TaxID=349095 RepID=A0A1G9UCR1_9FIRM|nr:TrbC/VirB2 family protein [Megasphaera paucivorans]SDM57494.1 type IV secretion system protein VirB2 [Megasphaera paucivorans]
MNLKKNRLFEKIRNKTLEKSIAATLFLSSLSTKAFASTVSGDRVEGITWPWMKFFNSLADQLTGPLPMTLGAMGIAGAAIALFSGHAGGGTQKFIVLILAVSICLFAPNFMTYLQTSAGGLTIAGVTP